MLKRLYQAVLDTLFPPKCPICHAYLDVHDQPWCTSCLSQVTAKHYVALDVKIVRDLESCLVLCHYRQGIKQMIHGIKYGKKLYLIKPLIWLLQNASLLTAIPEIDFVVPVPLHKERFKERGFNQTEKIFRPWAIGAGLVWQEILQRKKSTLNQYKLTIAERKKNVEDAFTLIATCEIQGKTILLVDDIFTTGATMHACAKVLKHAGAKRVIGLTIASDA
ncbi:ComF family protein [Anaerosinus massiliensis]|uniref:ComF family protein n=1 Tax=Massilibacillus massiliensis TaxID=1806837 RepID=UPI000A470123|nr:ComF family protein [Massilibacillus massiliensis]